MYIEPETGEQIPLYLIQSQSFLQMYLNKDLHDGTSFVSKNIGKIRDAIQRGVRQSKEIPQQFKDHFWGDHPE